MDFSADPECTINYGPQTIGVLWATAGIIGIVVVARFIISMISFGRVTIPDIFMALAVILTVAHATLASMTLKHGFGRVPGCIDQMDALFQVKYLIIAFPAALFGSCFGRMSCALYILKLVASPGHKFQVYFLWTIIILSFLAHIVGSVTILYQCVDLGGGLEYSVPGRCLDINVINRYAYFLGAFNAVVDLILTIIPMRLVWNLQMKRRTKIILLLTLCTSFFAAIASALRVMVFWQYRHTLTMVAKEFTTYWRKKAARIIVDVYLWDALEIVVIVITGSIPSLRVISNKPNAANTTVKYIPPMTMSGTTRIPSHWERSRVGSGATDDIDDKYARHFSVISEA